MATIPVSGYEKCQDRTVAKLHTAHRSWTRPGAPANVKRHTLWVYGQKFDVLEDEIGVVEVCRHRDARGT